MAAEQSTELHEAYPMTGGDGLYSYVKNSWGQKAVIDSAKELVKKAIMEKLDKEILLSFKTFRIADLGCSVGPNTYFAVQNILEAVEAKYQQCHQIPEFQVFYNDHSLNDFNLLFTSLPQNRRYYAAGVPGSFYGRLFPEASLHFVHCSNAIQWLSGAPKELMNKSSPAWNKSRIHYANSGDEVVRAYKAQFHKDMEQFLQARAQEIVYGGLMLLIVPGVPNGTHHSQSLHGMSLELLGSCLMDMASKGIVSEEKVDTFNFPIYITSPQELKVAVEGNGSFSIEIMEDLPAVRPDHVVSGGQSKIDAQGIVCHMRAASEGLFKKHFGEQILDVLFDSYRNKIEENPTIFMSGKMANSFVLLKRKFSTGKLAS